jgi:type IV secretory pathway VirB3-like protein
MLDLRPYARPVRRSLLQRDLIGGIPQAGMLIIFMLVVIFVLGLDMYFMAVPSAVLYLVMRALTKKDQWMIDIVLDNISQKDVYLP